jgi:hypothetical protein
MLKRTCQESQPGIGMTLLYDQSLTPPVHPASNAICSSFVPPLFLDYFLLKNPMNLTAMVNRHPQTPTR